MEDLSLGLKKMVIEKCQVRGVTADQIPDSDPVIGGMGLVQLDSLDAVEIATSLEQIFEIKAETMPFKNIFRSYSELSSYITKHAPVNRVQDFIQKYTC